MIHRAELLHVLYEACLTHGVKLLANHEVTRIFDGVTGVRVTCENGTALQSDAVVGADGLWSLARKCVDRDAPLIEPFVAYRGTNPTSQVPYHRHIEDVVMWIAPGLHYVQYAIRKGTLYNLVMVFRSTRPEPTIDKSGPSEELDHVLVPLHENLRATTPFIRRDRHWPMIHRKPIPMWSRGRLVLVGDAAHPMLQYIAQGACQAIEDATTLARSVASKPNDLDRAFEDFERTRVKRATQVQTVVRQFGEIIHQADPTAIVLRNHILRHRTPCDYTVVDWLYNDFDGRFPASGVVTSER